MRSKLLLGMVGIAAVLLGSIPANTTARAQDALERQLVEFRLLCEKGGRRACVRFGMLLERNRARTTRDGAKRTPTGSGGSADLAAC